LLRFHSNNCDANAPKFYVQPTLLFLLVRKPKLKKHLDLGVDGMKVIKNTKPNNA